jgi:hypothetical protein
LIAVEVVLVVLVKLIVKFLQVVQQHWQLMVVASIVEQE